MAYEKLNLDTDEHVLLEVRKHWFVFALQAMGLFFGAIFPFVFYTALTIFMPWLVKFTLPGNSTALIVFFYSLWLLFLWITFFIEWTKYYLDVWYVTEKRIIDVEQTRMFHREVVNIRFDKIEDITVNIAGPLATFLDFGTIKVQTAGETNSAFVMDMVKNPNHVREIIFDQHNEIGDIPLRHASANTPEVK